MRVIKFILFSCLFILCIVFANLIHKNRTANRKIDLSESLIYSDFIYINNGDIKSLFSISFNTSFDNLSKIFETDKNSIRNNILRKTIKVKENDGEIIVFVGDNTIEQITVNINDNVEDALENIFKNLVSNNINLNGEIIDDTDGNTLAEIYYFEKDNYKFVITKSNDNKTLSIDYINLKIL